LVPALETNYDLINILLLFIARGLVLGQVDAEILTRQSELLSNISANMATHIKATISTLRHVPINPPVITESDARRQIQDMIGETAYHGLAARSINNMNDWIASAEAERAGMTAERLKALCGDVDEVMQRYVIPGIGGMALWTKNRQDILAYRQLSAARGRLHGAMRRLLEYVASLPMQSIGSDGAKEIERLWEAVKNESQARATQILLKDKIRLSSRDPVIDRILPQYFSMPVEITCDLVAKLGILITPTRAWEDKTLLPVVACAVNPVYSLLELILTDMKRHGEPASSTVTFSFNMPSSLEATFSNIVAAGDSPRGGHSQVQAMRIAEDLDITLSFDRPKQAGDIYTARIVFRDMLACTSTEKI
jgi:hypothetical protein